MVLNVFLAVDFFLKKTCICLFKKGMNLTFYFSGSKEHFTQVRDGLTKELNTEVWSR